jgi:hypothetical protein
MRVLDSFIKISLLFIIALTLFSCGYKPSAKYSRVVVGESISTSVIISSHDPENTVVIKDAVDRAIIEIFHTSLTKREFSQTHLDLAIDRPQYIPLQYDNDGFIIAYRASIILNIMRHKDNISKRYISKGSYDFSVVANAVITDQERFDAIKYSATKAIKSFLAQVSAEGARSNK